MPGLKLSSYLAAPASRGRSDIRCRKISPAKRMIIVMDIICAEKYLAEHIL